MNKLYYTIGETAELLQESASCIRFWANSFDKYIHPKRNAKGNRLFTAEDLEMFRQIKFLLHDAGLTIEGAQKRLASSKKDVDARVRVLENLKSIRTQLVEIRKTL